MSGGLGQVDVDPDRAGQGVGECPRQWVFHLSPQTRPGIGKGGQDKQESCCPACNLQYISHGLHVLEHPHQVQHAHRNEDDGLLSIEDGVDIQEV